MSKHLRFAMAIRAIGAAGAVIVVCSLWGSASGSGENLSPRQLVEEVMQNELRADSDDHSHWIYRDHKKTGGEDKVTMVIETAAGDVRETVEINGQPLTAQQRSQDEAKMESFVRDSAAQQKQRQNSERDDQQARALMKMLPDAFIWTEAGESDGSMTLDFKPNPEFKPPTRAARVFAAMAGKIVVDEKEKRLKRLSGVIIAPVEFGWGLLGKLEKGGTFHIERTEIAPNEWQTTQTHVHIHGRALLFKSINQEEDEETSDYKPAPQSLSLAQATAMLISGKADPASSF
jgi:hypothetical protein